MPCVTPGRKPAEQSRECLHCTRTMREKRLCVSSANRPNTNQRTNRTDKQSKDQLTEVSHTYDRISDRPTDRTTDRRIA